MIAAQNNTTPSSTDGYYDLLRFITCAAAGSTEGATPESALERLREAFSYDAAFVYEHDPIIGMTLREFAETRHDCRLPRFFSLETHFSLDQISRLATARTHYTNRRSDDTDEWFAENLCNLFLVQSIFITFVSDDSGEIIGCVGMIENESHSILRAEEITRIETAMTPLAEKARLRVCARRLDYTRETLESTMDHIGFDIYVNDFDTHEMLYANKSMAEPYGGWENMRGKKCFEAMYDNQTEECEYCPKKKLLDENDKPNKTYSWDYQRPFDGRWFRVICAAFRWTDGRLAQVISSTDINEAKRNELLIKQMAYLDLLTGIPNRRKLEIDLSVLIEQHRVDNTTIAVIFLDLDDFKNVNDTYGHSGGDILLRHVSKLFSEHELTTLRCYRYGGDEFIFLFDGATPDQAREYGNEIVEILETPFTLDGDTITCTGSFGIASCPEDGTDYWTLLDKADNDMYRNKQRHKKGSPSSDPPASKYA